MDLQRIARRKIEEKIMLSKERLQHFLQRVQKIAQQQNEPLTIGFRKTGIIDPRTGQKYELLQYPFLLQYVFLLRGEIKVIDIPTTCFVLRRFQG